MPFKSRLIFRYFFSGIKYLSILFLFISTACSNGNSLKSENASDTTSFTSNDTIPEIRKGVSNKPVASYLIPINDPVLKQKFGVEIYETPRTFQFLLRMQYEGMEVTDTLKIPNFGMWPVVKINPGKDKLSCIIGFLDKKKEFKEYKMLTAKGDKMRLIVLKRYTVGVYRNVF